MSSGQKNTSLSTERFVGDLPKAVICTICQQVFADPTTCICGHTFCAECIEDRFRQGKTTCPICAQDVSTAPRSINFVVKGMIGKLVIKCLFETEGCNESLTVETLQHHETRCEFGPGTCPHTGCANNNINKLNHSLLRRDQDHHQRECEWRLVDCPNGCVEADYITSSSSTTTPSTIVKLTSKDVDQHKQGQCARQKIACDLGCGALVERRNVDNHKKGECSKRGVEETNQQLERGAFKHGRVYLDEYDNKTRIRWRKNSDAASTNSSPSWNPMQNPQQAAAVTDVYLNGSGIDGEDLQLFCDMLPHCPNIDCVSLTDCNLGDDEAVAIAGVLPALPKLTQLYLYANNITSKGADSLCKTLPSLPLLQQLGLSINHLGDEGVQRLVGVLGGIPSLTWVYLNDNGASDQVKKTARKTLAFVETVVL